MKKEQYEKPEIKTEVVEADSYGVVYASPVAYQLPGNRVCCGGG